MKLKYFLYLFFLVSMPLHASKVLGITFLNASEEDVQVKSFHLKNGTLLQSSHAEGEFIRDSFSLHVEHREEDFEDMGEKKWVPCREEDNYVMLQIKDIEFPLYWQAYSCPIRIRNTYYPGKKFDFAYRTEESEIFALVFSARGSSGPFLLNGKEYRSHRNFLGRLTKG
jgi:hypothetical protein